MSKTILTDVDGVILDWTQSFEDWIQNEKMPLEIFEDSLHDCTSIEEWLGVSREDATILIREFSKTDHFKSLPAFPDALVIIPALKKLGHNFIAITACDDTDESKSKREINLETVFPGVFEDVIFSGIDSKDGKRPYLKDWSDCYWVEDTHEHAVVGHDLGHTTFFVENDIRYPEVHNELIKINSWYDIFKHITGIDYE